MVSAVAIQQKVHAGHRAHQLGSVDTGEVLSGGSSRKAGGGGAGEGLGLETGAAVGGLMVVVGGER